MNINLTKRNTLKIAICVVALIFTGSNGAWANTLDHSQSQQSVKLGYEGHCPVCIVVMKKWVKGKPEHQTTFDGLTYYFPDAAAKQKFDQTPEAYVPALRGDCTVCFHKMGKRVPGSIRFASLYQNRVFLFPEEKQKQMFDATPGEFVNVDLAANGNCIVCQSKMNKAVPGKPEFTAIHNGMRYQFPSVAERRMFAASPQQFIPATQQVKLGYEGNCPVCLVMMKKWVKGKPEHNVTYDGIKYLFPDEAAKQKFIANPIAFVPALGGDCTVCFAKMGKRVPGKIQFASLHQNRVYLFPEKKQKEMFDASPAEYQNIDLAANGNCIVCSIKMGKQVPGKPEFTAIHNGMRYQFPSDAELQMFAASPSQFVPGARQAKHPATNKTSLNGPETSTQQVSIQGATSCAGCSYGVKPIGAPDELGLAVVDSAGKVFVIEESHTRWPELYKARFDGKQVKVTGTVLKTEGNFVWVKPTELKVL